MTEDGARLSFEMQSRHVGSVIRVARWGWFGQPVLLFPTAGGDAEECERMKMLLVLRPLIQAGRIKVYSCDSVGGRALSAKDRTTASFAAAQCAFDRFIADELVPWIRHDCETPDIELISAGASIGAFNAVAAACRHPDLFKIAIGLSGTYDLTKWLDPPYPLDFYFSSPTHFIPRLAEGRQLELLQKRLILLATGEGPWEDPSESWRLADILGKRGIPNRVDAWGKDYDHDWPTWREMLPRYLDRLTSDTPLAPVKP